MNIYLVLVSLSIGKISVGLYFGWSSPSVPLLLQGDSPVPLTLEQSAWVVSLLTIGAVIGSVGTVFVINYIGRKRTLLLCVIPAWISWLMIAFATTPWELYVARLMAGLNLGVVYMAALMYMGEVAPAHIRGNMASTLTVAVKFGTFIELAIGPFLSVQNLSLVSIILPTIFFITFLWAPESPYHLLRRGRYQDAVKSLIQLRGNGDISKEIVIIENSVKLDLSNDTGLWEILSVQGNRRALIMVLTLLTIQQWSGSLAVLSYAQMIFDAANNDLEGKYLSIILGGVQTVSTIVCASIVDRYGRRPLLMLSTFGTAVSTMMIGLYFFLHDHHMDYGNIGWLPVAGALLYVIVYCFGLAGIPFTMVSEVFPTNVKALGTTLALVWCDTCAFAVTSSYQSIADTFGFYTAFWTFSMVSVCGVLFIFFYVLETKGKTLQEIQEELHGYGKHQF